MLERSFSVYLDYIHSWAQLLCYILAIVIAGRRAVKNPELWVYKMLTGAFFCYALGELFWMLYYTIHWEYPLTFSAADLSWLGEYAFLISLDFVLMHEWTAEQRQAAKKLRLLPALVCAAVVLISHIFMVWIAGGLFNNLCYGAALFLTGYYSFYLLLAGKKENIQPYMQIYHRCIILYICITLTMFVLSAIGLFLPSAIADMALTPMPFIILRAANKAVGV